MLATPDLQWLAIDGLRKLNTPNARQALFALVQKDDSFTSEHERAIEALGAMQDATYAAKLLALWENSRNKNREGKLLIAAGRLDPALIMPRAQSLLDSANEEERELGVQVLAATERKEVLARLIQGLSDPSSRVRQAAAAGLVSLTRRTPSKDFSFWSGADPASDAEYWTAWLRTNPTDPIHLMRECPQEKKP